MLVSFELTVIRHIGSGAAFTDDSFASGLIFLRPVWIFFRLGFSEHLQLNG